jgi:hypothetical protein
VNENGLTISRRQILKKIEEFHKDVTSSLRLYVGFVLRFHVYLEFIPGDGAVEFVPKYTRPRHLQLKFGVKGGELIPPPAEPFDYVSDPFASIGGMPAQIRRGVKKKGSPILMSEQNKAEDAELIEIGMSKEDVAFLRAAQRTFGTNPEDAKLRFAVVDSDDTSSVTRLLDVAYDPLSITFLLVGSRGQTRLMCLVGELVSNDEWNHLGVVRAIVHKVMWGKAPAGAPIDSGQFAKDLDRLPHDEKISKDSVINAIGGTGSTTEMNRMEKRLRSAKLRLDRVRKRLVF